MKKDNSTTEALEFSRQLKNWFWEYGVKRQSEYELSRTDWLEPLYKANQELESINSQKMPRPSAAIWGPSQTGKSTLVAGYIDEMAKGGKGEGTALQWEGAASAFFSLPRGANASSFDQNVTVLNPYNGGMDASACITRFTRGTLNSGEKNAFFVKNKEFPVAIKFSNKTEITLSLARGYHGQCVKKDPDQFWNLQELKERIEIIDSRTDAKHSLPQKKVYEDAVSFCQVLEDLAFARLPRYRALINEQGEAKIIRELILGSKSLVSNKKVLDSFRAEVLWDNSSVINEFFAKLLTYVEKLEKNWSGKEIFCSLEAASCILDMDSFSIFSNGLASFENEKLKEGKVHQVLSNLCTREDLHNVFIGRDKDQATQLFHRPYEFGMFQGLIQEVIIPLNLKNLNNSPFLEYIQNFDLIDFPGVERGGQSSSATKIDLNEINHESGLSNSVPWELFFTKILKRGKTATLFQGYSRKLLIDAVSIFQDLDNDKPNAQDLITGVETWWRSTDSNRSHKSTDKSPLPLNCVMTWWSKMLNESPANRAIIFGKNQGKYEQLGPLSDPNIANIFAINDTSLPRGSISQEATKILDTLLDTIRKEPEFKRLFSIEQNKKSFESMTSCKDGGINFFFRSLLLQVKSSKLRKLFWNKKISDASVKLEGLLSTTGLLPKSQSKEKDRIRHLRTLSGLLQKTSDCSSMDHKKDMEKGLKQLLNIDEKELDALPVKLDELNIEFIKKQFNQKSKVLVDIHKNDDRACWELIGFENQEKAKLCWQSLCMSIEPNLKEIADWLRTIIKQQSKFKMIDYRRFLAVRMSNEFLGENRTESLSNSPDRRENYSTVSPIIEGSKNRVSQFINTKLKNLGRNEQSGDDEIIHLCESFIGKKEEKN